MADAYLGTTFDIHGGGQDLIFPHHENEIAQSTCAHGGAPLAHYWLHIGYVTVNGEKMSKSLGNHVTVRQLLEEGWFGDAIRLLLLSAHYRHPFDFTREKLTSCNVSSTGSTAPSGVSVPLRSSALTLRLRSFPPWRTI